MLPKEVERGIYEYFASNDYLDFQIKSVRGATGGDINDAAVLKTNEGTFFVKWNDAEKYPQMFEKEFKGLRLLADAGEIAVPKALHSDEIKGTGFLLMEAVISAGQKQGFWFEFGTSLAELHKHSNDFFGLDHDNYIGYLPQHNQAAETWEEFFVTQRLEIQVAMALDAYRVDKDIVRKFDRLYSKIGKLFPKEKPALLHGDLWSGNYMVGSSGEPVIIDPAVYYGHREMDLAMTKLFGGFDSEFYSAYHSAYPLEADWQERLDLCNLYPLMVHLNMFGDSYLSSVLRVLDRFV